jgi:hypothetical protein
VWKSEGKVLLGSQKRRWQVNIKLYLEEVVWKGVELFLLAGDKDKYRVINLGAE